MCPLQQMSVLFVLYFFKFFFSFLVNSTVYTFPVPDHLSTNQHLTYTQCRTHQALFTWDFFRCMFAVVDSALTVTPVSLMIDEFINQHVHLDKMEQALFAL